MSKVVNDGKWAEAIVSKSMRYYANKHGGWLLRLADTSALQKYNKNIIAQEQPADYIFFNSQGKAYFIEVKSSMNKTSYYLNYIKPHQWEYGKKARELGINYYFVIVQKNRIKSLFFIVPFDELYTVYQNRKSIKWSELTKYKQNYYNQRIEIDPLLFND